MYIDLFVIPLFVCLFTYYSLKSVLPAFTSASRLLLFVTISNMNKCFLFVFSLKDRISALAHEYSYSTAAENTANQFKIRIRNQNSASSWFQNLLLLVITGFVLFRVKFVLFLYYLSNIVALWYKKDSDWN
uniref:Uncharacterized protein n=1 Tax=Astyanax mexicanus TaxID=7994 RepID=A0A3B1IJI8_ASTMX